MNKVRVTYTKSKEATYIPYQDLKQVLVKAFTRAGVYVVYTKENEPRIWCSHQIELGIESIAEICDVEIEEHLDVPFIIKSLNQELPNGMVVLTAEYIDENLPSIEEGTYAVTYEISPDFGDLSQMTNRDILDKRKSYRFRLEEYLDEPAILVLVKSMDRSERIDIKPAILDYEILITDALKITVATNTKYLFNPHYIMDGFKEYVNRNVDYNIKRTKILYR